MVGVMMLNSGIGAAPPASMIYNFDAAALGAFPGASITTSASFDGSSQYLSLPASTNWALGTGDFTIEWWQYMTTQNSNPRVFSVGTYPGASIAVSIESATFYLWEASGNRFSFSLTGYLNTWIHFAISRVSGQTSVYRNGTQIGSTFADTNNINDSSTTLTIGQESTTSTGSYFTGYLSNFRIVKGTGIYTANFTPPSATLTAVSGTVLLLPLTAAPFMDMSTYNATVTNTGTTTTTTSAPSLTAATTDLTGNYSLTYSNTNSQISWSTDNGGVLRSTYIGDSMSADYIQGGPNYNNGGQSYTVFVAYKLYTTTTGRLINTSDETNGDFVMGAYNGHPKTYYSNGVSINLSSATPDTVWHLDWAVLNNTTSVGSIYSATNTTPSTYAYTATSASIKGFNKLRLFSRASGTEAHPADVGAVKVWNGALTLAQIQTQWSTY